jgi:hypothetical protein
VGRAYSTNREKIDACRSLVGKPEGKRPLGKPRHIWVDNIKKVLKEEGWDGLDWIDLTQDRGQWRSLVNPIMKLRVPQNTRKFLGSFLFSMPLFAYLDY